MRWSVHFNGVRVASVSEEELRKIERQLVRVAKGGVSAALIEIENDGEAVKFLYTSSVPVHFVRANESAVYM